MRISLLCLAPKRGGIQEGTMASRSNIQAGEAALEAERQYRNSVDRLAGIRPKDGVYGKAYLERQSKEHGEAGTFDL